MRIYTLFVILCLVPAISLAQRQVVTFQVNFKDKKIGTMVATQMLAGVKSTQQLSTVTNARVMLITVHMESEIKSIHQNGILERSVSFRRSNRGPKNLEVSVIKSGVKKYKTVTNGKTGSLSTNIGFCIIDLYFREPRGISRIFSNIHSQFLTVKVVGKGRYMVINPDKNHSYYTYINGVLKIIETDTPVGKVISNRI